MTDSRSSTSTRVTGTPTQPIPGLHHVTAIVRDPRENLHFYARVLGLRLVKKTVNFDDPGTYHLYYGDAQGQPGSIMTFFPWPGARPGRHGTGQTTATAFAVPAAAIDYWQQRLDRAGVASVRTERFGEPVLAFADPDGLGIELVGSVTDDDERTPWLGADVAAEHAIRGFDAVTLMQAELDDSRALLVDVMGFRPVADEADEDAASGSARRHRFESGAGGSGTRVDLLVQPGAPRGLGGAGTVHHVAFRNVDDASQAEWREHLLRASVWPTEVKDRNYFHSIYYREPGGVLFELATDPPGFAIDEPVETLGADLKLPEWLESSRPRIEAALPPLDLPASERLAQPAGSDGDTRSDAPGETS